jgi:hypothetical protein
MIKTMHMFFLQFAIFTIDEMLEDDEMCKC